MLRHPGRTATAALAFTLLFARSPADAQVARGVRHQPPTWTTEIAIDAGVKLGGLAIGDVDSTHRGAEVAAVAANGNVYLARRTASGWKSEVIYRAPGEMIQCAIGDADPSREGLELVVVGMAKGGESDGGNGAAHLVYRTKDGWRGRRIFEDDALIHGVAVKDGTIVVVGFTNRAHAVVKTANGDWNGTPIARLPGPGKNALFHGDDVVVPCSDGSLVRIRRTPKADRSAETWHPSVIDKRSAGRARIGSDGERLIVADDDGTLSIIDREAKRTEIHHEKKKLRGAVLADLDPSTPGLEAATAGYDAKVHLLRRQRGDGPSGWKAETIHVGRKKFHHLVAGDVDGEPGPELVACGYSGRVVVLLRVGDTATESRPK